MKSIYLLAVPFICFCVGCADKSEHDTEEKLKARLENTTLPTLAAHEELQDTPFTQFADKQFPELGGKWEEIRKEYNKTLQVIHFLESKRADLLVITTWEGSNINLKTAPVYLNIINKLVKKCTLLRAQHDKIEPAMQRYYAECTVKGIMGDESVQDDINELLKTTEEILKNTTKSE